MGLGRRFLLVLVRKGRRLLEELSGKEAVDRSVG